MTKIGFGGGCHWCTEAVFMALVGVEQVEQGWVSSKDQPSFYSEGVIVHFNERLIPLETLIHIHLLTHSSSAKHAMRNKYRSAVYVFSKEQEIASQQILEKLQVQFEKPIITEITFYHSFKINKEEFLNYYFSDTTKPFCKSYIDPKIKLLLKRFGDVVNTEKLKSAT